VDFAMLRTVIAARQQTCPTVRALAAVDGATGKAADRTADASGQALRRFAGHGDTHAAPYGNGAFSPYAAAALPLRNTTSLPTTSDVAPHAEGKNHA
jgi:hypothetical protein